MEIVLFYVVALLFVAWWADAWGRSVLWATLGSLILSPLICALVLLILGRRAPDRA